jgi:hypothetical protein
MAAPSADPPPAAAAILVPIPEAEPVAGRYRAVLDQAAGRACPRT